MPPSIPIRNAITRSGIWSRFLSAIRVLLQSCDPLVDRLVVVGIDAPPIVPVTQHVDDVALLVGVPHNDVGGAGNLIGAEVVCPVRFPSLAEAGIDLRTGLGKDRAEGPLRVREAVTVFGGEGP